MSEAKRIDKFQIGDSSKLEVIATEKLFNQIAKISGDENPIHIDEEYAKSTVFRERIAHGLFCLGMISNVIANDLPGEGSILVEEAIKYKKPIYIGDKIQCICTIEGKDRNRDELIITIECKNQNNVVVLNGTVIVKIV